MNEERALILLVAAALLALSSCDRPAAGHRSAQERDTPGTGTVSHDLGPFFHAEMEMEEAMMAAEGKDAGDSWLRLMIAHHKGGMEMARVFLQHEPGGPISEFARRELARQTAETSGFTRMLEDGPSSHESAWIYQPAVNAMHDRMMEVQGVGIREAWILKMIEYHRGAVEITSILLKQSNIPPAIRSAGQRSLVADQAAIRALEARR